MEWHKNVARPRLNETLRPTMMDCWKSPSPSSITTCRTPICDLQGTPSLGAQLEQCRSREASRSEPAASPELKWLEDQIGPKPEKPDEHPRIRRLNLPLYT